MTKSDAKPFAISKPTEIAPPSVKRSGLSMSHVGIVQEESLWSVFPRPSAKFCLCSLAALILLSVLYYIQYNYILYNDWMAYITTVTKESQYGPPEYVSFYSFLKKMIVSTDRYAIDLQRRPTSN
jgi:hypothetical protein